MPKKKNPVSKKKDLPAKAPKGYEAILNSISSKIKSAQARAMSAVNRELIEVYREIGETIHKQQKNAQWGDSVVEKLASDLQMAFPGMKGLSSRNLWRMRDFHLSYEGDQKLTALLSEISWTHHLVILEQCKDPLEREFYIRMSKKNSWSYRVLMNQISNKTFEKVMISQSNFDSKLPTNLRPEAKLAIKDDYFFGFLELSDEHSERELEKAIVSNIEGFLREVGGNYSFLGSQYRLEVDGQEYFVDLLFYHRKLKSLVAVELKVGDFIPEHIGKMQFYLSVLDDKVRLDEENPSIGIIICRNKRRTIVEYALKDANKPISVSSYHVVKELPKELAKELPSPEQMAKLLENID